MGSYDEYEIEIAVAVGAFVVFVLAFFLKATEVMTGVLVGTGVGWAIYRAIGWALYRFARRAWRGAADRLGLSYDEATTSVPVDSTSWADDLAMFVILLANSRINFSLSGRVDGVPIEAATERTALGRSTVVRVDFSGAVPDWLHIQKGWGSASSRDWFDVEDVLVGNRTFDDQFLVRGRDKDAIREFFVDHPIGDVLVDLGGDFHNIELADGELRVAVPTVQRRIAALVDTIETVADHAERLRRQLRGSETVAEFEADEEEVEEASEVHVYET